ncbi:hypothetical protein CVU75_01870 [Candidatus Dependentiae bacterium HGW-Dependentiae-1]|nr:MAG: hypothetical protein CVU75_01870 [Candidatus Dependentiae bacterium HGW-Dependentiae-1]
MKRSFYLLAFAVFLTPLLLTQLQGESLAKKTTQKIGKAAHSLEHTAQKVTHAVTEQAKKATRAMRDFFDDPALGGVYYYESMATNAAPIKEQIAGETFIKAAYHKFSPRAVRQALQKMSTKTDMSNLLKKDIEEFITTYKIDMSDSLYPHASDYDDFDAFFHRPLRAGVRKIDLRPTVVASPADCKLRALPTISNTSKFFIKQQPFKLVQFLNNALLASQYQDGTLLTFRLAPTDYHRFHFPFDCTPAKPELIEGEYETVNPIAFREGLWPISINKRARILLESAEFGTVIMVVVGASMVGSLNFTYAHNTPVKKGDEAGYFAYGGSTICLLFRKDAIVLPEVLLQRSVNNKTKEKLTQQNATYEKNTAFETAVRVGQGVAMKTGSKDVNLLGEATYVSFLKKNNPKLLLELGNATIAFKFNTAGRGR